MKRTLRVSATLLTLLTFFASSAVVLSSVSTDGLAWGRRPAARGAADPAGGGGFDAPAPGGHLSAPAPGRPAAGAAGADAADTDVIVLDTVTGAPALRYSGATPRSYMGDPFDAAGPPGALEITAADLYMLSTEDRTFQGGLCARIQFWEDARTSDPVFSGAVGDVQTFRVQGPVSLAADTYYVLPVRFESPLRFADRLANGFVVNYQGDDGGGCADGDTLTSVVRYVDEPDEAPIAVGDIPLSRPHLGYYRDSTGRAGFSPISSDLYYFAGTHSNAIAIKLYATGAAPGGSAFLPVILRKESAETRDQTPQPATPEPPTPQPPTPEPPTPEPPTPEPPDDDCYLQAWEWDVACKSTCARTCTEPASQKDCFDGCDAMTESYYHQCPGTRPADLPPLPPHEPCFERCTPTYIACMRRCDQKTDPRDVPYCRWYCLLEHCTCVQVCYEGK